MDQYQQLPIENQQTSILKILFPVLIVIILAVAGYFAYTKYFKKQEEATQPKAVEIPADILNNKFGFLSAGPEDVNDIKAFGAAWVRPHPGPFLWDSIQKTENAAYDFSISDAVVQKYQNANLAILATIWPFADWDQLNKKDSKACKVSDKDEFLQTSANAQKKGRADYLPQYRCAPNDWAKYQLFVNALVERYDGDGTNDMPNLKIPIKYWEVMNEPDLAGPENVASTLDFFKEGSQEYAELLQKTASAIRFSDKSAKVLISGAASGDDEFLQFYRQMFSQTNLGNAFDIGNIHCISSGKTESLNVAPYKKMLENNKLSKPIWVTEAQNILSTDADVNATALYEAVKEALNLGAEKIFFTQYNFESLGQGVKPAENAKPNIKPTLDGDEPAAAYREITAL